MSKFKSVLSNDELLEVFASKKSAGDYSALDVMQWAQEAVLAKLHEQQDHIEHVRGMVECESCGQEAIHYLITDNLGYPNKIPLCGGCTQDIPNIGKMVDEDRSTCLAESRAKIMAAANWLADIRIMASRGTAIEKEVRDAYKALELRVSAELAITQENANEGPRGWQLVPKTPNDAMLKKGFPEIFDIDGISKKDLIERYQAMLAAAPKYTESKK